jgi:hypothetical protein
VAKKKADIKELGGDVTIYFKNGKSLFLNAGGAYCVAREMKKFVKSKQDRIVVYDYSANNQTTKQFIRLSQISHWSMSPK